MLFLVRVLIRAYQFTLRPIMEWLSGSAGCCRFQPGCSRYFLEACEIHGVCRGSWLGVRRLGRCNPWGGQGFDPVPPLPKAHAVTSKSGSRSGVRISRSP